MTDRSAEEYEALRATIRARGTARVYIFALGLAVWAALTLSSVVLVVPPVATIIPLVCLAATFEGVFGHQPGAPKADPLFVVPFLAAALVNLLPLLSTTPIAQELVVVGLAHVVF